MVDDSELSVGASPAQRPTGEGMCEGATHEPSGQSTLIHSPEAVDSSAASLAPTESSARSSKTRDESSTPPPRIQLSPGSPCASSMSSSATSEFLKPAGLVDGCLVSAGHSPTSTSGSSVASAVDHRPLQSNGSNSTSQSRKTSQVEKRHICQVCGKAFPYLSILESHRRCHTGEKPFACRFCDKHFAQKATLQVHERTHTGERPYQCKYCPKTFAQYGTKTVHEKSAHLGIRNYKCPTCGKLLSSPSALYTHKKTHGDKIFQCPACPKTFTLKNYLKLHVRQVHQQNERRHVCRFCEKSFSYAGSLQVHVRTHKRPFRCRHCDKAFASQGNLQSHERTHSGFLLLVPFINAGVFAGERPYSCATCGRSFIQKSQLTSHEATHNLQQTASGPHTSLDSNGEMGGSPAERPPHLVAQVAPQRARIGEKPHKCEGCGKCYAQKVGLNIHLEQCKEFLLRRRGSVMTVGTTESDSSPSLDDGEYGGHIDVMAADEDKEPGYFLNAPPVRPQPLHLGNVVETPRSLFSSASNSQRQSFSSDVFFPTDSLLSPPASTAFANNPLGFPHGLEQAAHLNRLQCLNSSLYGPTDLANKIGQLGALGHPPVSMHAPPAPLPQPTDLLFANGGLLGGLPLGNNNDYKDALGQLLAEQQLLQNIQKLQQLLQMPLPSVEAPPPTTLAQFLPPTSAPPPSVSFDLLAQLQNGGGILPPAHLPALPPTTPSLAASLAAALNDLSRHPHPPMFIGGQ